MDFIRSSLRHNYPRIYGVIRCQANIRQLPREGMVESRIIVDSSQKKWLIRIQKSAMKDCKMIEERSVAVVKVAVAVVAVRVVIVAVVKLSMVV